MNKPGAQVAVGHQLPAVPWWFSFDAYPSQAPREVGRLIRKVGVSTQAFLVLFDFGFLFQLPIFFLTLKKWLAIAQNYEVMTPFSRGQRDFSRGQRDSR